NFEERSIYGETPGLMSIQKGPQGLAEFTSTASMRGDFRPYKRTSKAH
ncbi:11661_t:CDS:1, partial [Dentiscutata erythropus]